MFRLFCVQKGGPCAAEDGSRQTSCDPIRTRTTLSRNSPCRSTLATSVPNRAYGFCRSIVPGFRKRQKQDQAFLRERRCLGSRLPALEFMESFICPANRKKTVSGACCSTNRVASGERLEVVPRDSNSTIGDSRWLKIYRSRNFGKVAPTRSIGVSHGSSLSFGVSQPRHR